MNASLKKWSSIFLSVLLWLLIIIEVIFVYITLSSKQNDGVPNLFGSSPITIMSDSMKGKGADNFVKGDLVVIGSADTATLKVNDIITFWDIIDGKRAMNTHRIVQIDDSSSIARFYTKGDNNPVQDETAKTPSDIIGVYKFQLKGAGNVMNFLSSKWGFFFFMVVPLFLFFIWRLVKLIMAAIEYSKVKKVESLNKTEPLVEVESLTKSESPSEMESPSKIH